MEDTIKLPLDADGVPIRPGDVVYVGEQSALRKVTALKYGCMAVPCFVFLEGDSNSEEVWSPNYLHHPDTLEDIEEAISDLAQDASLKSLSDGDIRELVAPLIERIKRMVER